MAITFEPESVHCKHALPSPSLLHPVRGTQWYQTLRRAHDVWVSPARSARLIGKTRNQCVERPCMNLHGYTPMSCQQPLAIRPVRAVLLDVDGTLYYQERLRSLMAVELGLLPVAQRSYSAAYDIWRALSMFRKVREGLRHAWAADVCLAQWQYIAAAQRLGWEPAALERLVTEWLYQRPLKYLRFCRRRGLETFCASLENKGIHIGSLLRLSCAGQAQEAWRGREDVCHAVCHRSRDRCLQAVSERIPACLYTLGIAP